MTVAQKKQTFENHVRIVPGFHVAVFGVLVANLLYGLVRLVQSPSLETGMPALVGVALLGLFFYTRIFALSVQNRVIRLEMRLRLREILPPDLRHQIQQLSTGQLIALRFASDEELPALTRAVLVEGIHDRTVIKKRIRDWQADHLRC